MLVFVYHNVVQQHIRAWWAFVIPLFSGICKWIYAFGLDLLEGSRFPKGKICFEHQFSYVYKEVIKADFWFKGSGYYNEYPWAQSSSKKSIFTYTKPPTDTIIESCPRNASEEWRNSLCSSKNKISLSFECHPALFLFSVSYSIASTFHTEDVSRSRFVNCPCLLAFIWIQLQTGRAGKSKANVCSTPRKLFFT